MPGRTGRPGRFVAVQPAPVAWLASAGGQGRCVPAGGDPAHSPAGAAHGNWRGTDGFGHRTPEFGERSTPSGAVALFHGSRIFAAWAGAGRRNGSSGVVDLLLQRAVS